MEPSSLSLSSHDESERFRLLVASVTDYALYMLSPEGFVISWNAGAERFKGYAAAEVIGHISPGSIPSTPSIHAVFRTVNGFFLPGGIENYSSDFALISAQE